LQLLSLLPTLTSSALVLASDAVPAQVVIACLLTQMNYLNKALDLFNTAIVSPIYYVMFTLLTVIASVIMFQVRCHIPTPPAETTEQAQHLVLMQLQGPM
jgi:uncharacterized protein (DUF2062 family)